MKVLENGDKVRLGEVVSLLENLERGRQDNAKLEKASGFVVAVGAKEDPAVSNRRYKKAGVGKKASNLKTGGGATDDAETCGH